MSRVNEWLDEEPRLSAGELACRLARSQFWRDDARRFTGTHPDWPDAAFLLGLNDDFAHGLVLVLSSLPSTARRGFADAFFEERHRRGEDDGWPSLPRDARAQWALSAAVALQVVEIIQRPDIHNERILDILHGAAQGDDLTHSSAAAVGEVMKAVARIRLDLAFEDPSEPRAAAALALAEVLDPGGDTVALKEVFARSVWAAVRSWERPRVLGFLLDVDRLIADS